MYMSIAIACGVHICIERQPYKSDSRENKRMKSQLTYHRSFIRLWILACCVLIRPFAMSSLCVLGLDAHPSQSPISLLTKLHINIHYPHTYVLPYIN